MIPDYMISYEEWQKRIEDVIHSASGNASKTDYLWAILKILAYSLLILLDIREFAIRKWGDK